MNVNQSLEKLGEVAGLDVSPDVYSGKADKYITYNYADEHPVLWGDDEVLADQAEIQVHLYTPPKFNYMELKHKIRDYLETLGIVYPIGSWLDTYTSKNNLEKEVRHTVFTVTITKER